MQQPDDAEPHGDEEHRLQKLQDANCDEPAIAVWMGMRCQSAVLINPAFKAMIHPGIKRGLTGPLVAPFPQHARAWRGSIRKSVGHSGPYYQ